MTNSCSFYANSNDLLLEKIAKISFWKESSGTNNLESFPYDVFVTIDFQLKNTSNKMRSLLDTLR